MLRESTIASQEGPRATMPAGPAGDVRRYVDVVQTLAIREFVGRYRGNLMGTFTALLVPVLFLTTYTFVFSTLIPIRLRATSSYVDYAFFLFAGMIGWNLFAEPVGRAPRIFSGAAPFVRTARFPASSLPAAACLASLYQSLVWLGVFAMARLVAAGSLPPTIVLVPIALLLVATQAYGVALLIGSWGVLLRDLGELVAPLLALTMFVSPVLYPEDTIRRVAPWLLDWNPISPFVVVVRGLALDGTLPQPRIALLALLWTVVPLAAGILMYRRTRPVLGDVV